MAGLIISLLLTAFTGQNATPPADPDTIRVEGLRQKELERRASELVRAIQPTPVAGQMPRWNDPICPSVVGLDAKLSGRVIAQVRAMAEAAGAPLAGAGCKPNLAITFTGDARDLTARLNRKSYRLIPASTPAEKRELLDSEAPVRWWYAKRPEGSDGRPLSASSPAGNAAMMMGDCNGPCANMLPSSEDTFYLDSYRSGLVGSQIRVSIGVMNVLVDVNRAAGKPLDAVTAYVGMVALSGARFLPRPTSAPSILALFDQGEAAPTELTDWDRAYLKAIYAVRPNQSASEQRAAMAGKVAAELSGRGR